MKDQLLMRFNLVSFLPQRNLVKCTSYIPARIVALSGKNTTAQQKTKSNLGNLIIHCTIFLSNMFIFHLTLLILVKAVLSILVKIKSKMVYNASCNKKPWWSTAREFDLRLSKGMAKRNLRLFLRVIILFRNSFKLYNKSMEHKKN